MINSDDFPKVLCKGVFWITEELSLRYMFPIPCDGQGNIVGQSEYPLTAKNGANYNHKSLWSILPKALTRNMPFDYFPRGRVEIRNARATVYLHPDINTAKIQNRIITVFGLTEDNGIGGVKFVADGSAHYRYRID